MAVNHGSQSFRSVKKKGKEISSYRETFSPHVSRFTVIWLWPDCEMFVKTVKICDVTVTICEMAAKSKCETPATNLRRWCDFVMQLWTNVSFSYHRQILNCDTKMNNSFTFTWSHHRIFYRDWLWCNHDVFFCSFLWHNCDVTGMFHSCMLGNHIRSFSMLFIMMSDISKKFITIRSKNCGFIVI